MKLWMFVWIFVLPLTSFADKYVIYDDVENPVSSEFKAFLRGETRVLTLDLTPEEAQEIKAEGMIIEAVQKYKVMGWVEERPQINATWAAGAMRIAEAHKLSNTKGAGRKVCVIDTGIDRNHSLLNGKIQNSTTMIPGGSANDIHGHGTHVASLVVASTAIGSPAPSAKIISVKALGDDGVGDTDWIAQALESCADQGADVINMSLGSSESSEVLRRAVRDARARGVIVVAASGNDSGPISYPAAYPGVISVGATNSSKRIASFSNRGSGLGYVAPGQGISGARAGGGSVKMSGTSMASPFVAGMVALRLGKGTKALGTNDLGFSLRLQGQGQVDAVKTAK